MPKRITIHEEDYDRLRKMSHEDAGLVLHNLLHTIAGEPIETTGNDYLDYFSEVVCNKMMRFVELSERQALKGKKGGGQFGNTNAKRTENEPKTNQKRAKTNPNTNTNTNTNTNKKTYGECQNVLLTDEEYKKVLEQGLTGLIDELSFYIAGSGKTYKSHYAVIRQWANRRAKETKVIKPTQFNTGYTKRPDSEFDYDSLVKN